MCWVTSRRLLPEDLVEALDQDDRPIEKALSNKESPI
jgi:hypothetical protein